MKATLLNALDTLSSTRVSHTDHGQALESIEELLARALSYRNGKPSQLLSDFIQLQEDFQCNVPIRLLTWLSQQTMVLKIEVSKKTCSNENSENGLVLALIAQALNLIQGIALLHGPSKAYLARGFPIEVFLDLLNISRYTSAIPSVSSGTPIATAPASHIAAAVLDTLLCILVDSPPAIRALEDASGLEMIVKVLKRSATPKDVRMKCLEFLYFYLMDETSSTQSTPQITQTETKRPTSPTKSARAPTSRSRLSPKFSASSNSSSSSSTIFSSTESWSPTPTLAALTPPLSPTKTGRRVDSSHEMLRKEFDFVPLSPKKAQVSELGYGKRQPVQALRSDRSKIGLGRLGWTGSDDTLVSKEDADSEEYRSSRYKGQTLLRTTEEKKELLGQLLGNVDALVESVKKAGIWGLG